MCVFMYTEEKLLLLFITYTYVESVIFFIGEFLEMKIIMYYD